MEKAKGFILIYFWVDLNNLWQKTVGIKEFDFLTYHKIFVVVSWWKNEENVVFENLIYSRLWKGVGIVLCYFHNILFHAANLH